VAVYGCLCPCPQNIFHVSVRFADIPDLITQELPLALAQKLRRFARLPSGPGTVPTTARVEINDGPLLLQVVESSDNPGMIS